MIKILFIEDDKTCAYTTQGGLELLDIMLFFDYSRYSLYRNFLYSKQRLKSIRSNSVRIDIIT